MGIYNSGLEQLVKSYIPEIPPEKPKVIKYLGAVEVKTTIVTRELFKHDAQMLLGRESDRLTTALEEFDKHTVDPDFGTRVLSQYVKQGNVVSTDMIERYSLALDYGIGNHTNFDYEDKFWDVPYQFCLLYEGKIVASLGFEVNEGRLSICQIQGVNGQHEKIRSLKWERALVAHAVAFAKEHGIPTIEIQSAENSMWSLVRQTTTGKLLYDVTAKRSGFKLEEATGNYVKHLGKSVSDQQTAV